MVCDIQVLFLPIVAIKFKQLQALVWHTKIINVISADKQRVTALSTLHTSDGKIIDYEFHVSSDDPDECADLHLTSYMDVTIFPFHAILSW